MPIVAMENINNIHKFNVIKNSRERYKISLMYQVFMIWRWYNKVKFKVGNTVNTKTIPECDLLFHKQQLKITLTVQKRTINNNMMKIVFDVFKS